MRRVTDVEPLPDLKERIEKLGDPKGMTLGEVVKALGFPQYEFMSVDWILDGKPYLLMWDTGEKLYPVEFAYSLVCLGFNEEIMRAFSNFIQFSDYPT